MPNTIRAPQTLVYLDSRLAEYGFPEGHPFSCDRYQAFEDEFYHQHLESLVAIAKAPYATEADLARFHTHEYIEFLKVKSNTGYGFFDSGDTPAFKGAFEAALRIVGAGLTATAKIMGGEITNAFIPIGGLHHAHRSSASGFCIVNDCAIVIKVLQQLYGVKTIAYVDIDAHHGDGVYYAYEADPNVIIADIHQEGIFPGTGASYEVGIADASGTKLNLPLMAGSGDDQFQQAFVKVEEHLRQFPVDFILLQAGADCLTRDPLTGLDFTPAVHLYAAMRLRQLAEECCQGRLLAFGGGGYDLDNIAQAWVNVVRGLLK